jgi:hypothetical protein
VDVTSGHLAPAPHSLQSAVEQLHDPTPGGPGGPMMLSLLRIMALSMAFHTDADRPAVMKAFAELRRPLWRSGLVEGAGGAYGWTGQQSSSGFFDIARPTLGVFASLDRF